MPEDLSESAAVRVLIPTGFGLNCEVETAEGFRAVGASPTLLPLHEILSRSTHSQLFDYHILVFVGGFAFGDHLGAGFVLANKIRRSLYDRILEFVEKGGLILGICNGFQMMVRLGLLPGFGPDQPTSASVSLAPNDRLGYRNAWVRLVADPGSPCIWTRGINQIELPTRHGEGKFIAADRALLSQLEDNHQIPLRYADSSGVPTQEWPDNPNGSAAAIAGVCDLTGRIFGLMPHPDAYLYPFQHPQWSRRRYSGRVPIEGAGLSIFRNGVAEASR